jgi:hypothetical protein
MLTAIIQASDVDAIRINFVAAAAAPSPPPCSANSMTSFSLPQLSSTFFNFLQLSSTSIILFSAEPIS